MSSNHPTNDQLGKSSSGRETSAQAFHIRRQGGNSNLRDHSPSSDSDSSQGHGVPLGNKSTQINRRQSAWSFASRQRQRHENQRSSGNMASFKFPLTEDTPSRASNNTTQQANTHGISHQGPIRRQFHGQSQNEVIQAPIQNSTFSQASAQFQSKLYEFQQVVNCSGDVPGPLRDQLTEIIRNLSQEFNVSQRQLLVEWDNRSDRYNRLSRELEDARQEISSVVKDRARISSERDALQLKISELRLQHKSSSSKLSELEQEWKTKHDTLMEKLRIQEEQLKGKRALWLSSNPTSSARRDAMTSLRDPFNSPTRVGQEMDPERKTVPLAYGYSRALPQNTFSGTTGYAASSQLQPPRVPKALALPVDMPLRSADNYVLSISNSRPKNTEPGDTPLNPIYASQSSQPSQPARAPSTALVLREDYTDPCAPFQQALEELLTACENWAKKFTNKPNPANDRIIAKSNQMLWDYMMNCTYPGERQNAYTHVTALLNDPSTRYFFVMRMIVGYFVNDVLSVKAFHNFSKRTDRVLEFVKQSLEERGLANESRQVLIDQQCNAIQSIVDSDDYHNYRRNQLNHHTRSLRDMLGPLLNEGCERAIAGREIGEVTVKAWELSVKMYTSCLTFQIFFPETCAKFTSAIMNSRDHPNENPNVLQTKQIRVKLVMTPIITLRDDRSTTIRVKNLLHSDVLLMA